MKSETLSQTELEVMEYFLTEEEEEKVKARQAMTVEGKKLLFTPNEKVELEAEKKAIKQKIKDGTYTIGDLANYINKTL